MNMIFSEIALRNLSVPTDLADQAIDKDWKSTASHLGPDRYTPLRQAIEFKTSAALLTLMAGSMFWAYERLRKHTDSRILLALCEAIFCYQVDPLYLNSDRKYRIIPLTDGWQLPEGATTVYPWIFFEEFFNFPQFWPIYPTVIETARTIYLTRYIMPKRDKRYEKWTDAVIKKFDLIAPLPDPLMTDIPPESPLEVFQAESKRIIGQPLSPWALNVNETFDPVRNADEINGMLQVADPARNPFLRTPEELKAMGFAGKPYRYPQ